MNQGVKIICVPKILYIGRPHPIISIPHLPTLPGVWPGLCQGRHEGRIGDQAHMKILQVRITCHLSRSILD